MIKFFDYFYVAATIIFTVYGQLILKSRISVYGTLPQDLPNKIKFIVSLFMDFWILSGFAAGFLASLMWMAAMTKFELSHAYPFMSLNFVVVLLLSTMLLGENLSIYKIIGVIFIVVGTIFSAKG